MLTSATLKWCSTSSRQQQTITPNSGLLFPTTLSFNFAELSVIYNLEHMKFGALRNKILLLLIT
ncbi:hypothetical protein IC582_009964 [Cucumis melo]